MTQILKESGVRNAGSKGAREECANQDDRGSEKRANEEFGKGGYNKIQRLGG